MYLVVVGILLGIAAIIAIIWIAYAVSAAYQQTLVVTVPFEETYRYIPSLNSEHKFKLDHIKITITGPLKKDLVSHSTIITGERIKNLVYETVINPYKDSLLVHESNTFIVQDTSLKRHPLLKTPTLENLSVILFNKLAPLTSKLGCQLVSVKLISEGLKVSHSRYKMNTYNL